MSISIKGTLLPILFVVFWAGSTGAPQCPQGDLNEDCKVDSHDLRILAESWLDPECLAPDCEADLDGVPGVGMSDFALLAGSWAQSYSEITLVINEFMASNNSLSGIRDEWGDYDDWIEIYNYGYDPIDIGGMYLIDGISKPVNERWMIPATNPAVTTIPAGGYLVIWADGEPSEGILHVDFKLSATDPYEDICLFESDRITVIDAIYNFNVPVPQVQNKSYGRFPDGSESWMVFDSPTPGNPNKLIGIIISEIMYHPYHSMVNPIEPEDIREEYIELYNHETAKISLAGWRFSDGVDYVFPSDANVGGGQYLVVAADVNTFKAKYPAVTNVIGGWKGRLSNSGEEIELVDNTGTVIDRVHYADEGDWARRELGLPGTYDQGYRGWVWSEEHDGGGRSLELVNPALSNEYGQNWRASLNNGGTPGTTNSVATNNAAPLILDVKHRPRVPGPNDPVTVTAQIIDELVTGVTVTLYYRVDTSVYEGRDVYPHYDPNDYTKLIMYDNGTNGDDEADDGRYSAQIPPHQHGTIIEFFIHARDMWANTRTYPAPSYIDGISEQVTNLLYQVDETFDPNAEWQPGSQPIYYIIMTELERAKLEEIVHISSLEGPDSQMNATFISHDGVDMKTRYAVSVRNRGHGTRNDWPNNYRVSFAHDNPWNDVTAINLNVVYTWLQLVGNAILQMSGVAQCEATAVQVRTNGQNLALLGGTETYGSYVHVEVIDNDFAENHYPQDDGGNVYKCMRLTHQADLRYEGSDPNPYRSNYFKRTNTAEDDWSDLIGLTYALSDNTPDESYVDEVNRVMNTEQWLRFIAINVLMNNRETTLSNGNGDDYYLYRGVQDTRFVLIQHDLDSVFGLGQNPGSATDLVFEATDIPTMKRFIEHPQFAPRYYWHLKNLIETTFSSEHIGAFLDNLLADFVPASRINQMKDFVAQRNAYVLSVIPSEFTISSDLPQSYGYYVTNSNVAVVYGTADAVETRSVLVNGRLADWRQFEGQWEISETTGATVETLVSKGSVWKYLDDGSNQGTPDDGVNWFGHPDYNDSLWKEGPAELGYGDAADGRPEATVVDSGPVDNHYITTYFRHYFDVNDASKYTRLSLRILRDDGAVVYLNGVEIASSNMPLPPPPYGYTDYLTLASTNVFGNDADGRDMETLYYGGGIYANDDDFTNIDASLLHDGTNVLAVEIHQYLPTSADISFDLELTVPLSAEGKIPLQPGINRVIVQTFDGPDGTGKELQTGFIDIWYDDGDIMDISGTLSSNMILDAASGPWHVTGDIVVPAGITMTIEPGTTLFFEPATGITVQQNGRLVAEGAQYQRIRFTKVPGSTSQWDGVKFDHTLEDNRLCFVDHEFGDAQGESTDVQYSRVLIDNVTWAGTNTRVLNIDHPTVICRNSVFPSIGSTEPLHGVGLSGSEQIIFDGCIFGSAAGYNDIIDFTGGQRPGPIFQLYNSIFLGGGDDGPDLDSTDAHIEGNVFMNFHHQPGSDSTSNAIATGVEGGEPSEVYAVRNVFVNNDHGVLLKEDCFMNAHSNVFVDTDIAVISFGEPYRDPPREPGGGIDMEGNIFWNNAEVFEHFFQEPLPAYGPTGDVIINSSILPSQWHYLGVGNIDAAPLFVDPNSDFHLKPMSPAIGAGPWGLDMGAYVPAGAAICGEPDGITYHTDVTLTVGGPGITSYKYSLNNPDGPWSEERSVDEPVELTGMLDGYSYTVYAIGKNSAGLWQSEDTPSASRTWTIDASYRRLVINEVLAHSQGDAPDLVELYYDGPVPLDLTGMGLTDDPCDPYKFIFSSLTVNDTIMSPGEYTVLYGDPNVNLVNHLGFALSNQGEGLYLYDKPANGGGLVDSIVFGIQIDGFSIGRIGYGGAWKLNVPTFGQANIAQPLGDPAKLKINEWLANGEILFEEDFIELYNPEPMPVDLSNLYLTDNPVTEPNKQSLGMLSFIPPNGYMMFEADDQNEPGHLDFRLSADGEMIGLFDAELNEIDKVLYGPQTTDVSQGRTPDGSGNIEFFVLPTPGVGNPGAVIVTVTSLIDIDDIWSYDQSNTNLGTAWRAVGYNDSLWPTGNALFYVESAALPAPKNTPLTLGPPTYYFRKHFNLDVDPNDVTRFEFSTVIDDGAVIYINGNEVSPRIGMDEGIDIYFDTYANRTVGDADYEGPFSVPSGYFVKGDNVIAVEVHQTNATSTDVVFGLELNTVVETVSDDSQEGLLALLDGLRITEIMYHDSVSSDYDYIELQNVGDEPLDVNGVRFTNGIGFTFPPMTIDVGEYVVVVSDMYSFDLRYDTSGITIAGQYTGNLDNGGEKIVLKLPVPYEAAIMRFSYDDAWYPMTDGLGMVLSIIDANAEPDTWNEKKSWQQTPPTPGSN